MRIHLITPNRNKEGNDFEGAFKIEADRFVHLRKNEGDDISRTELGYECTLDDFNNEISRACDWLIILCHGGPKWVFKPSFVGPALTQPSSHYTTIYACSAGKDETSPAAYLSKSRFTRWVDGHAIAGHTTSNPYVVRWQGGQELQLQDSLKDASVFATWTRRLRERHEDSFRFEFPLLSVTEIIEALRT